MLRRLFKYHKKGFNLTQLRFKENCKPWYIQYVLRHMSHIFKYDIAQRLFNFNIHPINAEKDFLIEHVAMSYLPIVRKPEWEKLQWETKMQHEVLEVVCRHGNATPGLVRMPTTYIRTPNGTIVAPDHRQPLQKYMKAVIKEKNLIIIQRFYKTRSFIPRKNAAKKIQQWWQKVRIRYFYNQVLQNMLDDNVGERAAKRCRIS